VHRLHFHLRAVVPLGGAVHPHAPGQDLRGRDRRRGDCGGEATEHRPGPGADPEHGRQGGAGARLPPPGQRAAEGQGPRCEVLAWHAHHRRSGAGLRPGGRRPAALRDRGGLQHGAAEHADGGFHGAGDLRELRHRAARRHRRRRGFPAFGPGAQGRRGWHPAHAGTRRHGAAVPLRLLAHRRGLQPDDGGSGHQRGHRPAGRQAGVPDRDPRHPRAARRARIRREPDRHRAAAGGRRTAAGPVAQRAAAHRHGVLPPALRESLQGGRRAQPHPAVRRRRIAAAGGVRARRHRHHGDRREAGEPPGGDGRRRGRHPAADRALRARWHPGAPRTHGDRARHRQLQHHRARRRDLRLRRPLPLPGSEDRRDGGADRVAAKPGPGRRREDPQAHRAARQGHGPGQHLRAHHAHHALVPQARLRAGGTGVAAGSAQAEIQLGPAVDGVREEAGL
ncbi:MAG: N-acetylglutamate synthase, partial [uncultured Ramlibacter sp.]